MGRVAIGTRIWSVITEGADPSGTLNSQPAFAAAVAKAVAAGGGIILVPGGIYLLNSVVTVAVDGIRFIGDGASSKLINGSTNQPCILFQGTERRYDVGASGLRFACKSGVTGVAGQCGLKCIGVGKAQFSDLETSAFPAKLYDGLIFEDASQTEISRCAGSDTLRNGVTLKDCLDIDGHAVRADANGGCGFYIVDSEGLQLHAWKAWGNDLNAWLIDAGPAADNKHSFLTACVGDTSGDHDWKIARLDRATLTGCWGSGQKSTGVNTTACGFFLETSACDNITFLGGGAQACNGHGVRLNTNGGTAPSRIEFYGFGFGDDSPAGNGNGKGGTGYGLSISDESTNVKVFGGHCAGNATGAIAAGASGAKIISVTGYTPASVSGSRGVNAALASLLTNGAALGLWTDGSTSGVVIQASDLTNNSDTTPVSSDLTFNLVSGKRYRFRAWLIFSTDAATTGITLRLDYGANTNFVGTARAIIAAAGASAEYQSRMNASGQGMFTPSVLAANEKYLGQMEGIILPTANVTITVKMLSEVASSVVTLYAGSFAELAEVA